MTIKVELTDDKLPAFKRLLDKGMNTWDQAPAWLWALDAQVTQRIATLKVAKEVGLPAHDGEPHG